MKLLKSPFSIISKYLIVTGFIFILIFYIKNSINFILSVCFIPIIMGFILLIYIYYKQLKFNKLKKTGLMYDVTILKVVPVSFPKIRGYFTFYIEGKYTDSENKEHLVKSCFYSIRKSKSIIFLDNNGLIPQIDFSAKIYVDNIKRNIYYVQVKGEIKSKLWFA